MAGKYFVSLLIILMFTGILSAQSLTETVHKEYPISGDELEVLIRIEAAEFTLSRSNRANVAIVNVDYKDEYNSVDVTYDEDGGLLSVRVNQHNMLAGDFDDDRAPKILVELPAEPTIDLDSRIRAGEIEYILGDLSLQNCRIRSTAGEVTVNFDQPNRIAMDRLDINCSIGETDLENLGNARFARARINSGIGELTVSFSGDQIVSGQASLDLDLGSTTVLIPRNSASRIRVSKLGFLTDFSCSRWFSERNGFYYSSNYVDDEDHFDLAVSSGIGELVIRDD